MIAARDSPPTNIEVVSQILKVRLRKRKRGMDQVTQKKDRECMKEV
jgi:hypothetical protein